MNREAKRDFYTLVNFLNIPRVMVHQLLEAFDRCDTPPGSFSEDEEENKNRKNTVLAVKIEVEKMNLLIDRTGSWIPVGRGFLPMDKPA